MGERREAPAAQRRGQRVLGGGAAPRGDRERRLDVGLEHRRQARAAAAELEAAQRPRGVREPAVERAAARDRQRVDEQPELRARGGQPIGRRGRAIGVRGPAPQVALREPADRRDDHLLLVIEREVHAGAVPRRPGRRHPGPRLRANSSCAPTEQIVAPRVRDPCGGERPSVASRAWLAWTRPPACCAPPPRGARPIRVAGPAGFR